MEELLQQYVGVYVLGFGSSEDEDEDEVDVNSFDCELEGFVEVEEFFQEDSSSQLDFVEDWSEDEEDEYLEEEEISGSLVLEEFEFEEFEDV